MICSFCEKVCLNANSHRNHERTCLQNKDRVYKNGKTGKQGSNQYIKAKQSGSDLQMSDATKDKIRHASIGRKHSIEFKDKQRERALARGLGGVRPSRRVQYNGITLGSTYELDVAKSLDENGIDWTTCKKFHYVDPFGKSRTYTPDFYLPEYDIYLDPKNDFLIENINPSLGFKDSEKIKRVMEQNDVKILILDKDHLNWDSISQALNP